MMTAAQNVIRAPEVNQPVSHLATAAVDPSAPEQIWHRRFQSVGIPVEALAASAPHTEVAPPTSFVRMEDVASDNSDDKDKLHKKPKKGLAATAHTEFDEDINEDIPGNRVAKTAPKRTIDAKTPNLNPKKVELKLPRNKEELQKIAGAIAESSGNMLSKLVDLGKRSVSHAGSEFSRFVADTTANPAPHSGTQEEVKVQDEPATQPSSPQTPRRNRPINLNMAGSRQSSLSLSSQSRRRSGNTPRKLGRGSPASPRSRQNFDQQLQDITQTPRKNNLKKTKFCTGENCDYCCRTIAKERLVQDHLMGITVNMVDSPIKNSPRDEIKQQNLMKQKKKQQ